MSRRISSNIWRGKESISLSPDELNNEDIFLRHDYEHSIGKFFDVLNEYSANEILSTHMEHNRVTLDGLKEIEKGFKALLINSGDDNEEDLSDEEDDMSDEKIEKYIRELLEFNHSKLNKTEKQMNRFIFGALGMEPSNEQMDEVEDISRHYVNINVHEHCRKYYIEGDSYFYDFYTLIGDPKKDFCLSIGTCSFYPFKQDSDFNYGSFMRYLNKTFNVVKQKALIFSQTAVTIEGFSISEDDVIEAKWIHKLSEKETTNCSAVWNTFKYFSTPIGDNFKCRYNQSIKIQSMDEDEYTILKFGQLQEIYGFLGNIILKKGEKWKLLRKFGDYIYRTTMVCKFHSEICNFKVNIVMDTLHQIVFLKIIGSHADTCAEDNKSLCYQAYRNLILSKSSNTPNVIMNNIKLEYRNCYTTCVAQLGYPPTSNMIQNWRTMFNNRSNLERLYKNSDLIDYFKCVGLIKDAINEQELISFEHGLYRRIAKDPNSIIYHFNYGDFDKNGALLFASKDSLSMLMEAEVLSVDATFNMLKDNKIKFITVSFRKETIDDSKPRVFLGCIATLPGGETSRNYTIFFLELRSIIKRVFGIDKEMKVKTILTDESQAEMTGISVAFHNRVSVRNCVWHKKLTFERNLDVKGVRLGLNALYAITELECTSNLLTLANEYKRTYDDIKRKSLLRNSSNRLEAPYQRHFKPDDSFVWSEFSRDRTKKHTSVKRTPLKAAEALVLLKKKIEYVYNSLLTRERWSFYARIKSLGLSKGTLDSLKNTENSVIIYDSVSKCLRNFNQLLDDMGSTINRSEIFEEEVEEEDIIDYGPDDVEAIAIQISALSSTQASESMHSTLKFSYKIRNKQNMVLFCDAITSFFDKQDQRMRAKPKRFHLKGPLASMDFIRQLSDYKKSLFYREYMAIASKNFNLMQNSSTLYDFNSIEDFDPKIACSYCLKCKIVKIPCKHVMAHYLQGVMDETGLKKEKALPIFISKIDTSLMELIYPKRKRKSTTFQTAKRRKQIGETMDLAGRLVARNNETRAFLFNTLYEYMNDNDVHENSKNNMVDNILNLLEDEIPGLMRPTMSDNEVINDRDRIELRSYHYGSDIEIDISDQQGEETGDVNGDDNQQQQQQNCENEVRTFGTRTEYDSENDNDLLDQL